MPRFNSLQHAINGIANTHFRQIQAQPTAAAKRKYLADQIDLAWLPDEIANRLNNNDRAWREFLNAIIKEATW